jgi:hypothetical protein
VNLENGREWFRVADPGWLDPLDPMFAMERGGRWNPPGSFPTLYLSEDVPTARAQVMKLLEGTPVDPEDLDGGFDLVLATLPRAQVAANATTDEGLAALGLPTTYPRYRTGRPVGHDACRRVGADVHAAGLRGVYARSAATRDGTGRELAWFPARGTSTATLMERHPFRTWWHPPDVAYPAS